MFNVQATMTLQSYHVSLCDARYLILFFFSIITDIMSANPPLLRVPYQHFPKLYDILHCCQFLKIFFEEVKKLDHKAH